MAETKKFYNWPLEPMFHIPDEALAHMRMAGDRGKALQSEWRTMFEKYMKDFPAEAEQFQCRFKGELPEGWDSDIPAFSEDDSADATRNTSGKVLNVLAQKLPNLIGGSADLAPSNKTFLNGFDAMGPGKQWGPNIHFGVREHSMGAIVNGIALYGGLIPFGATFLIFSDYMRPALRLAALMNIHAVFVYTHDSIGVGEDGPTHQPIEQLPSLRAIPNFAVIRPADANETAAAWRAAVTLKRPVALLLTRQKLPVLKGSGRALEDGLGKGAYVVADCEGRPEAMLLASGSEVQLAVKAQEALAAQGVNTRVVSMPCWELFEEQSQEYRDAVLPPEVKARVAVETAATLGWRKWTGDAGEVIGIDRFGASAPADIVMKKYGFTTENVVKTTLAVLGKLKG